MASHECQNDVVDPIIAAIISGLLGGGVAGATIGALVTFRQQRRAFEHEKETRFIDLKRQRYADLLRIVDDWVRTITMQHTIAVSMMHGDASEKDMPTLGPTTAIEQLTDEIDLLAPKSVARHAAGMLVAIFGLGKYAYDAERDLRHMIEPAVPFREAMVGYAQERNRFLAAAKSDLGTA